jgi:hypothetical protein
MHAWIYRIFRVSLLVSLAVLWTNAADAREDDDFFVPFSSNPMTIPPSGSSEVRSAPSRIACVRTCDGYFFPLPVSVGRHYADEMCQALCPASATKAYAMSASGTINQSRSLSGQPYSALTNAGAYQKFRDPSCACRSEGESWEKALEPAESLLGPAQPSDIFVTVENQKRISLLASGQKAVRSKKEDDDSEKDVLTAGFQSSGVGPKIVDQQNIQRLPLMSQSANASLPPRTIAPHIIPVPARIR